MDHAKDTSAAPMIARSAAPLADLVTNPQEGLSLNRFISGSADDDQRRRVGKVDVASNA
ncbi:MAG: hypothetical protein GY856_38525 [bacterium]|nr:hypothetical protein [bacterium]